MILEQTQLLPLQNLLWVRFDLHRMQHIALGKWLKIKKICFLELFGVDEESRTFIFDHYLPKLDSKISHIQLSLLEKAELTENTIGSVMKLLYAFFWQVGQLFDYY